MIAVAFDLRDPERSGIARAATSIARAFIRLHSDEFSVSLAGPMPALRAIGAPEWGVARIVDWSEPRYTMLGLGWRRAHAQIQTQIQTQTVWYYPHWDVPLLAMGSPFVATINDLAHLELAEHAGLKRAIAQRWIQMTVARARRLTAISSYTAKRVSQTWPHASTKLAVVPLGVDGSFFEPRPALPEAISNQLGGDWYMLSVGIRKERKNLIAGVQVLKEHFGLKWIVVGESFPEWARVEAAARKAGVADRIIVMERQSESTLRALYGAAQFLFFPSRYEGFGLPMLEAMASGVPVIASNSTSIPEILGEDGWMCEPHDIWCFARAARQLFESDEVRAEEVERGRARAREFTWERAADGIADALRSAGASLRSA